MKSSNKSKLTKSAETVTKADKVRRVGLKTKTKARAGFIPDGAPYHGRYG